MRNFVRSAGWAVFLYTVSLLVLPSVFAMDGPGFAVSRMVVCEDILAREPLGVADTFAAATEKVYCFLEARDIEEDTDVSFVWYYNDREMARVVLPLRQGGRWRTNSSKQLAGLKGQWKVELQDASGAVLNSVSFLVE